MSKIAIIMVYFGEFKPSFALFYESYRWNPEIDWLIFTDNSEPKNAAANVKWNDFTLEQFNTLATERLGEKVEINNAYKLCDFKPMYGLIFEEYLSGYSYWGFGDLDLINGKLFDYLKKINYEDYDKINRMGHLTVLKNNKACRELFMVDAKSSKNWKFVLNYKNCAFDELDFNLKLESAQLKIYDGIFAADISGYYNNMNCVDKKTLKSITNYKYYSSPKNY